AQEVLKHKYPAGDLDCVFRDALEALLDKKDPERRLRRKELAGRSATPSPTPTGTLPPSGANAARRIPQAVRDQVWRRDGGQCVFVGDDGERCPERGGLEFDHIVPFAVGGPSNNPKNIRLLCKAHNLQHARGSLGDLALRRQMAGGR